LDALFKWSRDMQMKFHPEKCKVLHLGYNNPLNNYTMCAYIHPEDVISRVQLEETECEKDLGIYVDNKLKFAKHVQESVNKANRVFGMIRSSFKYLDNATLVLLYKSMVRHHLEYGSPVWNMLTKGNERVLENVQRRVTRSLPWLKDLSYPERLKVLGLPTLAFRRLRNDMLLTFKLINNYCNMDQNPHCQICQIDRTILQKSYSSATWGTSFKLKQQHNSGVRARFFSVRIVNAWNSLSNTTRNSDSVESFKTNIEVDWKDHILRYNSI
jgi:hypothetical protein